MPHAVSNINSYQYRNLYDFESAKMSKINKGNIEWKISEQRHALLFSFARCIVSFVCRRGSSSAGWQAVCSLGGAGGG